MASIELRLRRLAQRIGRAGRAWRYCFGGLTSADARQLIAECQYLAGLHPLVVLAVEDVLAQARVTFADNPDLPWIAAEACLHVERRWSSSGDDLQQAQSWAVELVERYADVDGIALERRAVGAGK